MIDAILLFHKRSEKREGKRGARGGRREAVPTAQDSFSSQKHASSGYGVKYARPNFSSRKNMRFEATSALELSCVEAPRKLYSLPHTTFSHNIYVFDVLKILNILIKYVRNIP